MTTAAVDVVIGLVLMFLLLSLICTVINEFIASIFQLRASNLAKGIEKIIDDQDLWEVFQTVKRYKLAGRASGKKGPSYISSRTLALSLLEALDPEGNSIVDRKMEDVRHAIDRLPKSGVKDTLAALARDTHDDFDRFRDATAEWFDDMMDRLGGVYKRNMQYLSLFVALALAVIVDGDSFQVATALWMDDALREAVAESAVSLVASSGGVGDLPTRTSINEQMRSFPLGWGSGSPVCPDGCGICWGWLWKVLGWLFTALAVSLGAPFWFDLLNKFVKMRGSGGAPVPQRERRQPEGNSENNARS